MKIFITSGGTKVPIDAVRDITNQSKGTFGSKIAKEFLDQGHKVHFFHAKNSKTPFLFQSDVTKIDFAELSRFQTWAFKASANYYEYDYVTYDEYAKDLELLIKAIKPDVVILAAAVSDYITKPINEKIRSKDDLTINLQHAEKLISKVKIWCPQTKLIGFKLLVNSSNEELIAAAKASIENNNCDFVVANDYTKLKNGEHEIIVVDKNRSEIYNKDCEKVVVNEFYKLFNN